jgi:hypothetical protein
MKLLATFSGHDVPMTVITFARKSHGTAQNNAELQTRNPELQKQAADVRNRIHSAVGQVVLALTVVPRYRHQSIADLQSLVLEHGQKKWNYGDSALNY